MYRDVRLVLLMSSLCVRIAIVLYVRCIGLIMMLCSVRFPSVMLSYRGSVVLVLYAQCFPIRIALVD